MPHKRGSGSLYRDKHGYWCASVPLGGGKTTKTRRKREADARQWMADVIARRDARLTKPSNTVKLVDFLAHWLAFKEPEVAPRTFKAYKRHSGILCKHIGHIRLVDLTTKHVREMCAAVRASGHKGHAPNHAKAVLHNALEMAIEDGLITRNVAHFRLRKQDVEPREAVRPAELAVILEAASADTRLHALWWLLATYGVRRGELLGIRAADVDLEASTLTIRQAVDESGAIVPVKSRGSRRVLPLTDEGVALLSARLAALDKERQAEQWTEHGLLFPTSTGTAIRPRDLQARWRRLLKRAGLSGIVMHQLRHTAATDLAATGADVKSAQRILGHSNIQTTMNIYAHGRIDAERSAMEKLAEIRRPRVPGVSVHTGTHKSESAGHLTSAVPHQDVVGRVGT
jgi:integrase